MKILMLGWELPPHNSGGLGVACYQMCKALAQNEINIQFVLPYTAKHSISFMKVIAAHPQNVVEIIKSGNAYDSHKYIYKNGNIVWKNLHEQVEIYEKSIDKIVKEQEFDIIHAHDWLTCRAALRAKQQTGKPLVLHIHSIEADRAGGSERGNPLVREIEKTSMLIADKVIAVSNLTKASIVREYGIPENKIDVIHNSIDRNWYEDLSDQNSYSFLHKMKEKGYKVVVNIGRITIQKGLHNLLYAAKEVVTRTPKTFFLIVGNGEQETELIELAAQLGISQNVLFVGFQRGKNLRDAYAIGDLFVMPSVSEPFGLTPLEAIGYGTPALISKQSGVSEVLQNCLKVDYWDVLEMANQITSVVIHNSLRDELHANSLKEYERLSWNSAAAKLDQIYNRFTPRMISA